MNEDGGDGGKWKLRQPLNLDSNTQISFYEKKEELLSP